MLKSIVANYSPGYLLQSDFVNKYNPQIITLSIGGNDIGFEDIVKRCVAPAVIHTTCYASKEDQQELVNRILNMESTLQNTYRSLSAAGRKVYVIGYPQIVYGGGNCANNVHLDDQEIRLFTDLTDTLNSVIEQAADAAGVHYVDVSDAFVGHRMCETSSSNVAVNGLTAGTDTGAGFIKIIGAESYHPNVLGHELLKQAILLKTNRFKNYEKISSRIPAPSAMPYPTSPATGRTVNLSITDNLLVPDIVPPLTNLSLHVDSTVAQLKSSSAYTVKLDATTTIGSATTDATGSFSGSASLPAEISCGYHTMDVYGQNIIGQPVDIYKEIYVSPSDTNCDQSPGTCGIVSDSGVDADKDGIDDACDPLISDPPAPASYKVYLTGNSIHAVRNPY
jgi:lysophospholipase L1-like esterase